MTDIDNEKNYLLTLYSEFFFYWKQGIFYSHIYFKFDSNNKLLYHQMKSMHTYSNSGQSKKRIIAIKFDRNIS